MATPYVCVPWGETMKVGFTSRSDGADPEDVRATLRPYHERVKADIERWSKLARERKLDLDA